MIEVDQQINAVRRTVGSRTLDIGEARTAVITQTYRSPIDDVWDACTNPERIPRWFMPVTGDLRIGGRYQLEGNAGGVVESCDPPRAFAATWEFGGNISWIDVRLSTTPDGTLFTLEHTAQVPDEFWTEYGPGAVGVGWDLAVLGLAMHLSSGAAVDPAAVAEWSASAAGRQFNALASARWRDASIAAGTDPAQATAAAERTTAFYSGVPAETAGEHATPEEATSS